MINFNLSEETEAEKLVKSIVETGVNTVVVGGTISDLCLHFLNKYGLFVLKIQSKYELIRLCRLLNANVISSLRVPTKEDIGFCDLVEVKEIGSTRVTVFKKDQINTKLATIILRGATNAILEDVARALENGVSSYKQALFDGRYLYGAAAIESYLVNEIEKHANTLTGLEQYGCLKFG